MKTWWHEKKEKRRKRRSEKNPGQYTFGDFMADLLLWVPELLLFPFRILFWLVRGLGRVIGNFFDLF
ncbi:hypothetical protein [Bacillus pinisoli]|uniref:hypothetical protein n=1 Tax=Bacillus pinisoli TaxID=2901866 RepID=UPI001FF57513|nr:hypothetical protein [Bacillus pinisoli]